MAQEGSGQTPEKQLLKLIEDPQGSVQKKEEIKRKGSHFLSWSGLKGRFSFFKSKTHEMGQAKRPPLDLRSLNIILVVCIVGSGIYLGIQIRTGIRGLEGVSFEGSEPVAGPAVPALISQDLTTEAYFLDQILERDLFDPLALVSKASDESDEAAELVRAPELPRIQVLVNDITLVGISWSRDPDILVEDTEKQRTYFLKRGDVLENGLKVEAIFKDYVVLSFEGQEMELR